jgi:hypothetical protein
MIYALGDSFTYGVNFYNDSNRLNYLYPHILSKKFNTQSLNLSNLGSSNWRSARLLQTLKLNPQDIVIIQFSSPTRFEFGVNPEKNMAPVPPDKPGDLFEVDLENKLLISKRFFYQLTSRTSDGDSKTFNSLAYTSFYNTYWFEEMFKIMYNSMLMVLIQSGCKWIMFNGWRPQVEKIGCFKFHKNYISPHSTMCYIIHHYNELEYWSKEEHEIIASKLEEYLNELY